MSIHRRSDLPLIVAHPRALATLFLGLVLIQIVGAQTLARIVVVGDAAATAGNVLASEPAYRFGIATVLLILTATVVVALLFYQWLRPFDRTLAGLMVVLALVAVPISMLNELSRYAIPIFLGANGAAAGFDPGQSNVVVMLFMDLHATGSFIGGIFWGLWLLPYAYLLFVSGVVPRIIPILLVVECAAWLVYSVTGLLLPSPDPSLAMLPAIGSLAELLVPIWLLVKGADVARWERGRRATVAGTA
jgi:hypothetical protein